MVNEKSADATGEDENISQSELIVVGIGASAGGLEALQKFISGLPAQSNFAYVVAQHLSPTHKSMMVELLAKDTKLSVVEAKDDQPLERDHIYICPPNKNITIKSNAIRLGDPDQETYSPKPNVNFLLESIAETKGQSGVGIILSGTGSDGSRGISSIKAYGGFTFAEDPNDVKYDGMPNSAILTGNIDFIMPADRMGEELVGIWQHSSKLPATEELIEEGIYRNIVRKLASITKVDFSNYKVNTIQRRIERRMTALKMTSLSQYNNYVQKSDKETRLLFKDILIGVTSFFRDKKSYDFLEEKLREKIKQKDDKNLRVWVAGCSTGEEAYSIAMIISDILGHDSLSWNIQIFATDIDENALEIARKGVYPESAAIVALESKTRRKYFRAENEMFTVVKPVRDMVIFSRHNIMRDPPFLRLDLISCRNLLIYFNQAIQKKIIPAFHYALVNNGLLFLGKSETIGRFQKYFTELDKEARLFEGNFIGERRNTIIGHSTVYNSIKKKGTAKPEKRSNSMKELLVEQIQKHILPMCVLVNESHNIVYVSGKNPFITRPDGDVTDNIFKNVNPIFAAELRIGLKNCNHEGDIYKTSYHRIEIQPDVTKYVRLLIMQTTESEQDPKLYMICFQEEKDRKPLVDGGDLGEHLDETNALLELELARTKEQLQAVIEELETSNEELQSVNEELQSSNEELQSTNEELETTNEELQSTNEELQTAYSELKSSYEEKDQSTKALHKVKADLERSTNLINRVQKIARMGLFELDLVSGNYELSNEVFRLFNVNEGDFIASIDSLIMLQNEDRKESAREEFKQCLKSGSIDILYHLEIHGRTRIIRQKGEAMRSSVGVPVKVYGTFQDITDLEIEREMAQSIHRHMEFLLKNSNIAMYLYDLKGQRNVYINDQYSRITGYSFEEINEMSPNDFLKLFHPDDRKRFMQHKLDIIDSDIGTLHGLVYRFQQKSGEWVWCHAQDMLLERNAKGEASAFLGAFIDVDYSKPSGKDEEDKIVSLSTAQTKELEIGSGIVILSKEGDVLASNRAFSLFVGQDGETINGKLLSSLITSEDRKKFQEAFDHITGGDTKDFEISVVLSGAKDQNIPVSIKLSSIQNSSGYLSAIIAVVQEAS